MALRSLLPTAFLAASFGIPTVSHAQTGSAPGPVFYTVDRLLEACHGHGSSQPSELVAWTLSQGTCQGYVFGVVDTVRLAQANDDRVWARFCLPDHTGTSQVFGVVLTYLERPGNQLIDGWPRAASDAVVAALAAEFPCTG
jgi:hypothetical protein